MERYTAREVKNAAKLIRKYEKISKTCYNIGADLYDLCEDDSCWDYQFLMSDKDTRSNPIKSIDELKLFIKNNKFDVSNGTCIETDPALIDCIIPLCYQYHEGYTEDNSIKYSVCIDDSLSEYDVIEILTNELKIENLEYKLVFCKDKEIIDESEE